MKKQVLMAVGLVVGVGTALAWAQQPGRPEGPRAGGPPERRDHVAFIKQQLGLTDAQMDQLKKIHQDERRSAIRRRADLQIAHLDLRGLMEAPTVDDKAVAAKVKELSDLTAQGIKAKVDGHLAMRKILTAEQFKKFQELGPQREMMRRRGPGGDGNEPGGPGPHRRRGPGAQGPEDDDEPVGQPLTGRNGR